MSFPPSYHTARAKSQRELSGEVSRAKAVRTAVELFATSGFKGTSIAKVAAESGLSQSGLLHHFPSKVALLSAVLEERDAEDGVFLTNEDGEAPLAGTRSTRSRRWWRATRRDRSWSASSSDCPRRR